MKRSTDWLTKQLVTIGSTAAGVIAGESPYQTPLDLYRAMVAANEARITEKDFTDDMRRGLLTEALHRQLLEDELGKKVHEHDQDMFLTNSAYPWAHALPDGWVFEVEGETRAERMPVQLKCPRPRSWHEIKLKGIHGYWLLGSQHTLAVTGSPFEYFSVLNVETMRLIHFPVYRDDNLIARLMQIEEEFFRNVEQRMEPILAAPQPLELPPAGGELVTLETEEAANAAATFMVAEELVKEAQSLYDTAKTRIKDLMGDARVAQLPGGLRCYNIQQQGRVTLDRKALERDGIDLAKYEKRGEPFTQFRPYHTGA